VAGRYRAGIIACGIIAQSHLRAYRAIPEVEVVAGADISPEVRERWEQQHGIPKMYAGAQEMLERERQGNPPEIRAKLAESHRRFLERLNDEQRKRVEELFGGNGAGGGR